MKAIFCVTLTRSIKWALTLLLYTVIYQYFNLEPLAYQTPALHRVEAQ